MIPPVCTYMHAYRSGLLPTSERSLEESLTRLLAPVMDLITTAQNRAYLSQDTVHSALHLLLSLIRGFMSGSNDDKEWNGMQIHVDQII